jgi:AcrR family transcriptional regulator
MSQLQTTVKALRRTRRPVNMAALAKELGISRATLYRRMGSAKDIKALIGEPVGQRRSNEEVFAAVKFVLGERGLRGTTLEAVAERAGVSAVTLHRRFGDRTSLLRAFIDAIPARRVGRTLAGADPARVHEVLLDFTSQALRELEDSLEVMRAMLGAPLAFEELSTKLRDPSRGVSAGVFAYFTRCVAAGSLGPEARALTTVYLSSLFGFALMARKEVLPSPSNVTMLVSTFLQGALPRSGRC